MEERPYQDLAYMLHYTYEARHIVVVPVGLGVLQSLLHTLHLGLWLSYHRTQPYLCSRKLDRPAFVALPCMSVGDTVDDWLPQ